MIRYRMHFTTNNDKAKQTAYYTIKYLEKGTTAPSLIVHYLIKYTLHKTWQKKGDHYQQQKLARLECLQ